MTWYEIFPQILNMSLTASVIICVVILCRLFLKRAPKIYSYLLWSVVLFRLLCPVSFSAPVSVLGIFDTPVMEQTTENAGEKTSVASTVAYIPTDIVYREYPEITLPIPGVGNVVSEAVNERLPSGEEQLRADPLEFPVTFATYLWMIGIMGMLASGILSYVRLRSNIVGALKLRDNVYVADHIFGPFVIGMIKPKIYLPSDLDEIEHSYIILHEKHHIRRGDPIFKMVAYIALCIHWFNPLVWLFFKLFVKDMEMSCDEAVIKKLGDNIRADYSASLLQLATGRQMLFGSPLAFGETEPAGRIKNISRWKKPTIVISVFAILLCIIAVIVSIFNPVVSKDTLRMIEQESLVMGNVVKYEVNFGKKMKAANVYAEVWKKGECEMISCLPVGQEANVLCIQMKDRKVDGKTAGVDIRLESDVPGGMQVTYAELPEELSAIGWAFIAYEEGDTVDAISGEEKILAAMAFDSGEGVRVFDPENLLNERSRLEQAEYMLVIRAVFEEEGQKVLAKVEPENNPEIGTEPEEEASQPTQEQGEVIPVVGEGEFLINDILLTHQPDPEKVSIRVQPSVLRKYPSYYYTPEEKDQQWLLDYMENLPDEGEAYARQWGGLQETGWQIAWQDKLFMVFEGGYIYFSYRDAELGMREIFVEEPKLCDYIQIMLQEKLGYYTFEPEDIKDIVSAELEVQSAATDGKYHAQTITDTETLQMMEFWFGQADYMFGGADCCNEQACLTLTMQNGEKVQLSVATDSCPNFGINGVYYDYRPENDWDNQIFFELFDEIPWNWLEEEIYVPVDGGLQETNRENTWQENDVEVFHGGNEDAGPADMLKEDAECIFDLLNSTEWAEGTTDCISDWLFVIGERRISYHSDCGSFNDLENEHCLRLDEKTHNAVNALLKKYVRMGAVNIIEEVRE